MRLTPPLLLGAYARGWFPMADPDDGSIAWYEPDPRALIPLDERFHVPRRLAKTIRQARFEVRVDTAFQEVMERCADPGPGREDTWISRELVTIYTRLHRLGFAHSVECWREGALAGGLYGVALRGLFAGESMFSRVPDASKVALVHLVERLRRGGFRLLDTQFLGSDHLLQFGAYEVSAAEYQDLLAAALEVDAVF